MWRSLLLPRESAYIVKPKRPVDIIRVVRLGGVHIRAPDVYRLHSASWLHRAAIVWQCCRMSWYQGDVLQVYKLEH